MFEFSSKTQVNRDLKLSELLKLMHADKRLKDEASVVKYIHMTTALSERTTGLKSDSVVKEIYVLQVLLTAEPVPYDFLKALDRTIQFQVVFEVWLNGRVKYITGFKNIADGKMSQTKFVETTWQPIQKKEMPLVNSLQALYKAMLDEIAKLPFRQGETIKDWQGRLTEIEKLEKEFDKIERQIEAESQPKQKFALNEQLRELYSKIKELKA